MNERLPQARKSALAQEGSTLLTHSEDPNKIQVKSIMITHALLVRLEAKPGKEEELMKFLQASLGLAQREGTTPVWFALQLGPRTFGIFDAFTGEGDRQAHLNGPIAQLLGAKAPKLLAQVPLIERADVLGAKLPDPP